MTDPLSHVRHPVQSGSTTLFLVRHGQTDSNVRGLLHGRTDVPLDELGIRQAACIAKRMVGEGAIDVLISSPLQRALATAQAIGDRLGLKAQIMPELSEIDFGKFEGIALHRLLEEHPEIVTPVDDLSEEFGWPDGETRRGFHERVYAAFLAILSEHHAHRVAVVAHGGVIGSFLARVHDMTDDDWSTFHVENCSYTRLAITEHHTVLHAFNDVTHLAELSAEPERLTGEPGRPH